MFLSRSLEAKRKSGRYLKGGQKTGQERNPRARRKRVYQLCLCPAGDAGYAVTYAPETDHLNCALYARLRKTALSGLSNSSPAGLTFAGQELYYLLDIRHLRDRVGLGKYDLLVLIDYDVGSLRKSVLLPEYIVRPCHPAVRPDVGHKSGLLDGEVSRPGFFHGYGIDA